MEKVLEYSINLCYNYLVKGGDCMYSAEMLLGQEYFSNKRTNKKVKSANKFREVWRNFTLLKAIVKDPNFDEMVKDNIVKDKKIKSGTAIIKGTRISTYDVMHAFADGYDVEEVLENFPTIKNKKQVLAAMVYEIRNWNFFFVALKYARDYKKDKNETFM